MSPRRYYPRRGYRPQKRRTVWVRSGTGRSIGATPPIPAGTLWWSYDLLPSSNIDFGSVLGSTVVRMRGHVLWMQTGTTGNQQTTIGIRICDRSDISATNPRWDPIGDANDRGWMYWERSVSAFGLQAQTGDYVDIDTIDTKVMRKIVSPSETLGLFVMHQEDPAFAGGSLRSQAWMSTLLKLA